MSLHSAARVGVIVPSGNAAAEPEIAELMRPTANVHTARFPQLPGQGLRERLDTYNEILPQVLSTFGKLALDAAVVACSGSHYLLDPQGDRRLCDQLGDSAGYPVTSSTLATLDTCADLGITDLVLVSPYEPWLTELSRSYWEQAGLKVARVLPIQAGERFSPYDVTTEDLVRQVEAANIADDAALLFTGTGMFTFDALQTLGTGNDRVLLTSNICSARWAYKHTGAPAGVTSQPWQLNRLAVQAAGRTA
ncbi:arylmalonate decarboxylase [Streptomyces sp. CBMA123]|uniref:maleate cis-trans isomerase family protein n=1 Tax=Streptomyces sp. CBMA123 TaxID=1896313 RepID=UPI001661FF32|nr:arylmalonate decarboxylase [Streptomyces sp. CBMA123]MBD0694691.1 arylmalonate decarboxylase [Streptomyces sp. CBMA123]